MSVARDTAAGLRRRPKRVITPARKEQNRLAQRAYRQRQKELLRDKTSVQPHSTSRGLQPSPFGNNASRDSVSAVDDPVVGMSEVNGQEFQTQLDLAPLMLNFDCVFPALEGPAEQETGDILLDTSGNTDMFTTIESEADDIIMSSPWGRSLELTHTTLMRACLHNARSLGISVQEFFGYNCMSLCSPFYRPNTSMNEDPRALVLSVSHPFIPPHLQPTLPQILFPHHPLLDLLPLPGLRSRAIMLAATAPNFLDPLELKTDIVSQGGIVCYAGDPWDKRSWIIAPWFLKKWRLLLSDV